jgi:hypothetical protein
MKMMADEIKKKGNSYIRPYFRWTGSELAWVEKGASKQPAKKRRKRKMEERESEDTVGEIKRLRTG